MFQAISPPIIRSSKLQFQLTRITDAVYTVLELLMMGGETAQNM